MALSIARNADVRKYDLIVVYGIMKVICIMCESIGEVITVVIGEKQLTLEEFHIFCEQSENRDKLFELIDGDKVQKVPSFKPSQIAMRIGWFVGNFSDDFGYVTGADGSYSLSEHDEFIPDVAFISKARLPQAPEREVIGAPDLAVEVKSPTDSKRQMRLKAEAYLRFGTKIVWLVFPDEQRVEVYLPNQDVVEVDIDGVLEGGDVLPGFTLKARDIF